MRRWLLLSSFVVMGLGCDPCADYCEAECQCPEFAGDAGCVDTCLETLDLYPSVSRSDECSARLDELDQSGDCR